MAPQHYRRTGLLMSDDPQGCVWLNPAPPGHFGGKIADGVFKCILFNENDWTSIKISLNFVPKGPFHNESALVQVMAWRRQATSHYLDRCWPSSPTYICGTREIRVNVGNLFQPSNIMRYPHNALPTSHDSFLFIEMQINCKLIEDQQGSFHALAYKDARNPLMQHSFLLIVVDYFITVVYKRYHSMNGWYFKPYHFFFTHLWASTVFLFPLETVRKIDAYAFAVIYKKHIDKTYR